MYSNPTSISVFASSVLAAVLHVHSSDDVKYVADSMFMYTIVFLIDLCPSICMTWIMSLVLWYSVVAFQCRNVWKVIFFSLGLFSLVAILLRSPSYVLLIPCFLVWNTSSLVLSWLFNMATNFLLIGRILGLLCFSGFMLIVCLCRSKSVHCVWSISPIRAPVSLSSCKSVAVLGAAPDIKASISCSVGMNGIGVSRLYLGFSHVFPINFKNPL